jgi:hypothetical protein
VNDPNPAPNVQTTQPYAIPWWQSPIVRNLAISMVTQVLAAAHLSAKFTTADISQLVDIGLQIAAFVAAGYAARARFRQTQMPQVTLSQKKADVINTNGNGNGTAEPPVPPAPETPK